MNKAQYKMIKDFLAMGNTPKTISQALPESIANIKSVARSLNYEEYLESNTIKSMLGL